MTLPRDNRSQVDVPEPPEPFSDVPRLRYWGTRRPPKNRADMFGLSVRAAAAGDTSAADSPAPAGSVATLRIYGPIDSWGGFWGISAADVSKALDGLGEDVTEIRVRINSPGGEAWEGLAILNMLRAHRARVVAVVDGVAASAASYIATGADETVMSPGTQLMIHDASAFAYGPAAVMRKAGTFLDSVSNAIASLYAEAAGGTDAAWRAVMVEETWYTAQEAVDAGLADRVGVVADAGASTTAGDDQPPELDPMSDDVEDRFDLSIFNFAGRSHAPAPKTPAASATGLTSSAAGMPSSRDTNQEGDAAVFNNEQLTSLRQKLGVSDDADAGTVLSALDEALNERASDSTHALPPGTVTIDEGTLAQLRGDAAAGRQALDTQRKERREALVSAAVRDGRIPSARKDHWLKQLEVDAEGGEAALASLQKGTIPVQEIGHDTLDDAEGQPNDLYGDLFPEHKKEG